MTMAPRQLRAVLLAEDQAMVLGAFASLLELEPDVDVVATNGEQALQAVMAHDPDVLLTDIEMPRRTGLDVAADLHAGASGTKVVIVTTFARSGYLRRALEAGVAGYVLKDAPIHDLAATVGRVRAGDGNAAIARQLHLAEGTVRNYLSSAITKLHATNRTEAARLALERGWL